MPVSADVQNAISRQYMLLADSITHAHPATEKSVLGPHFADRARAHLDSFEYDPLAVIIRTINADGTVVVVHAQYVGVRGHNGTSIDRWKQIDGDWRLLSRS